LKSGRTFKKYLKWYWKTRTFKLLSKINFWSAKCRHA